MSLIDSWGYKQFLDFSMVTRQDVLDRIEKERKNLAKYLDSAFCKGYNEQACIRNV